MAPPPREGSPPSPDEPRADRAPPQAGAENAGSPPAEEAGAEPGGALLYRTTDEFLEYLGVNSLEDLPPLAPYLPDATVLDDIENETIERSPR